MSSLRELARALRGVGVWTFFKRLYTEITIDNVFTNAAAMAYAWMFAVFPFVIFVLTLIPYLPEQYRENAVQMTRQVLEGSMQKQGADAVLNNVGDVINQPRGGLLSVGLLLTLFAASGGMNATMSSLDQAFDIDKPRKYLWKRLVAMMLTIFMCVCLIVIVMAIPVGTLLTNALMQYNDKLPAWARDLLSGTTLTVLTVARYVIGLTVMQLLIGVIYHFGKSRREHRIRFFTPGSIVAAVGWIGTAMAMRFYLEHFSNYSKTYGAVAGMVVMLMVFYINAIIILVGAEIDSEIVVINKELSGHLTKEPGVSGPHASSA